MTRKYCTQVFGSGQPGHTFFCFFFFNDTATTEIYTLSLHDALPICAGKHGDHGFPGDGADDGAADQDRKSTRLNSSHDQISYAVFCLKKKTELYGVRSPACGAFGVGALRYRACTYQHSVPISTSSVVRLNEGRSIFAIFFFFNDRAPPEISPLPLPDPFPI